MARYTGPKHRLCRREGVRMCNAAKCPLDKKGAQAPGQHGKKMSRRQSDFGKQLREKQKTKRMYGLMERQFHNYYVDAARTPGNTGIRLLQILESRLDNIVYRSGFIATRPAARQLVSHGHVLIDGKKVDIPSYQLKPGQTVTLKTKALTNEQIKKHLEEKATVPSWLKRKAAVVKMDRLPTREEIDSGINEQLIIEFYSR
jgi:small subunit ribosomal protein S4